MGLDDILSVFRAQKRINDDIIDRLSHHWTVLILVIFVIITSTSQYAGDPIHCWCPAEFSDAYVDYAEAACWIKNTYYIPIGDEIPLMPSHRKDAEIQYYQWVPIILAFQALLFKLPYIFWKMLHKSVGINIDKVVKLADNTAVVSPDDREEAISILANCVKRWLDNSKQLRRRKLFKGKFNVVKWCFWNKHSGRCLIFLYLVTKLLYLLNAISQFFLLDAFMGYSFHSLGIDLFSAASKEEGFKGISRFPRTTLCDFKIRQLSNIQTWTVQCILSVNLFSERIFVSVWFILVFVSIFTACGIFKWIRDTFYVKTKESFVKHYLKVHDQIHDDMDKKLLKKFLSSFLGFDGLFVLRIVSQNSSEIFTGDLILRLWKEYKHPDDSLANGDLDIDRELKNGMSYDPDKRAGTL
ncbi:hypothetical protein SNE40_022677 [Patella caerulea]|uniref:Innexin n=1 Tax=Patella caerulea TaxID=87958 RepID=A0AAN8IZU0_PATCE